MHGGFRGVRENRNTWHMVEILTQSDMLAVSVWSVSDTAVSERKNRCIGKRSLRYKLYRKLYCTPRKLQCSHKLVMLSERQISFYPISRLFDYVSAMWNSCFKIGKSALSANTENFIDNGIDRQRKVNPQKQKNSSERHPNYCIAKLTVLLRKKHSLFKYWH